MSLCYICIKRYLQYGIWYLYYVISSFSPPVRNCVPLQHIDCQCIGSVHMRLSYSMALECGHLLLLSWQRYNWKQENKVSRAFLAALQRWLGKGWGSQDNRTMVTVQEQVFNSSSNWFKSIGTAASEKHEFYSPLLSTEKVFLWT